MHINISYDYDPINPAEDDEAFRIVSFSHRHYNFVHPDTIELAEVDGVSAFWLDCFQHGNAIWSLTGSGPQCRWDTARRAGVLYVGGEIEKDHRRECAEAFLKDYTAWCNGEVYFATLINDDGSEGDSIGGIYDPSTAWEHFGVPEDTEIKGDF